MTPAATRCPTSAQVLQGLRSIWLWVVSRAALVGADFCAAPFFKARPTPCRLQPHMGPWHRAALGASQGCTNCPVLRSATDTCLPTQHAQSQEEFSLLLLMSHRQLAPTSAVFPCQSSGEDFRSGTAKCTASWRAPATCHCLCACFLPDAFTLPWLYYFTSNMTNCK